MQRLSLALLLPLLGCPPATEVVPPTESDTDTDTDADTDADTDTDTDTDADTDTDTDTDTDAEPIAIVPGVYAFPGRATPSEDSVAYSGQVFRQLLVNDLAIHLDGLTDRLNTTYIPTDGMVEGELEFYLDFDSATSGTLPPLYSTQPALLQTAYDDVSTDKDLTGKLAGNDAVTDHVDWSTSFEGWGAAGSTTPEALVRSWFATIDDQAVAWTTASYPLAPDGTPVEHVYLTDDGLDLRQLLDKFLRGGVFFSQAADDYLDDDVADKGLNSDHTTVNAGSPYTTLEHQWDEGFGYFGAATTYGTWTDEEIVAGHKDVDGDGAIDLLTEVSVNASVNAAKRDLGAVVATDFTRDAFTAFHAGRELLATTDGALLPAEAQMLSEHRDDALEAWEKAIAATVVHYINDTLQDMNDFGTTDYSYTDHAKHWSELKGFALGFQFNPRSALTDAQFTQLHGYLDDRPVLPGAEQTVIDAYATALRDARTLIGTTYGFDAANLGDVNGENGW